jgi:probable rRNA maturation factor
MRTVLRIFDEEKALPESLAKEFFKNLEKKITKANLFGREKSEINLIFLDNAKIKELNLKHRQIDEATDVLSFNYAENQGNDWGFELGEIFISVEKAAFQAQERRVDFFDELEFLVIHGVLHLAGFTHETAEKMQIMLDKTNEIMGKTLPPYAGDYALE